MARSEIVNIQPPLNVLAWCDDAESACHYAIQNTGTGAYLKTALVIIRQQYREVQRARNDLIDATAEAAELRAQVGIAVDGMCFRGVKRRKQS
jgi:hypothetical protein